MGGRYIWLALGLYLAFGIGYQIWTCATWSARLGQDGLPPDLPCAGMPWTAMNVGLWPIYSARDLQGGYPIAGAIFAVATAVVAGMALVGLRALRRA